MVRNEAGPYRIWSCAATQSISMRLLLAMRYTLTCRQRVQAVKVCATCCDDADVEASA